MSDPRNRLGDVALWLAMFTTGLTTGFVMGARQLVERSLGSTEQVDRPPLEHHIRLHLQINHSPMIEIPLGPPAEEEEVPKKPAAPHRGPPDIVEPALHFSGNESTGKSAEGTPS
jgi:hypothetical protein